MVRVAIYTYKKEQVTIKELLLVVTAFVSGAIHVILNVNNCQLLSSRRRKHLLSNINEPDQ